MQRTVVEVTWTYVLVLGGPRSIQPRRELYTELSDHLWLYLSNYKCKRQSAISKASTRSRTMTQRSNKKQTGSQLNTLTYTTYMRILSYITYTIICCRLL